ncbi:MAG: hypothetical protein IKZ16_08900 [Clostridia bacterium]|nr:hypothetical protein [Clostridia bacterium]
MKTYNRFTSRGTAQGVGDRSGGAGQRVVNDNRKPIYIVYILDKSGSMGGISTVINENGEAVQLTKIDQLNEGVRRITRSLKEYEANSPLFKIYVQIIELDSYGKAVFPEFQAVSRGFEEICFEADGCTELRASLTTLKTFISPKYLRDDRAVREDKGYNKAVSVILMSDGWPTDCNGVEQTGPAYRGVVDEFKQYLRDMDYARNVDLYSMAVGDDACEDMLRYFCDGDQDLGEQSRFYRVEECESIASALDYLTRATLAHHTTRPVVIDDADDDEDGMDDGDGTDDLIEDVDEDAQQDDPIDPAQTDGEDDGDSDADSDGEDDTAFDGFESDTVLDGLFDDLD